MMMRTIWSSFLPKTDLLVLRIQTSVGWEVLDDLFTHALTIAGTDPSGGAHYG